MKHLIIRPQNSRFPSQTNASGPGCAILPLPNTCSWGQVKPTGWEQRGCMAVDRNELMMVTCSASLRKAWLQDPNSYLAPEQQGTKSEARHLKISPRVRIGNTKTICIPWIALPRRGGSGWRRRVWCNGTQAEDGDKKKTRRHHWNGSAVTLASVPVSTFRAAQWSPPPALIQEQHWILRHHKNLYLLGKRAVLPTVVAAWRFHSAHITQKHRSFVSYWAQFTQELFLPPSLPGTKYSPASFSITNLRSTYKIWKACSMTNIQSKRKGGFVCHHGV